MFKKSSLYFFEDRKQSSIATSDCKKADTLDLYMKYSRKGGRKKKINNWNQKKNIVFEFT